MYMSNMRGCLLLLADQAFLVLSRTANNDDNKHQN